MVSKEDFLRVFNPRVSKFNFYHYIKRSITYLIFIASCIKQNEPYSLSIRRAFIPSSRCLLISADYSQMELRIFAHMSRDHKLTKLLQNKEADVFKSIAGLSYPMSG